MAKETMLLTSYLEYEAAFLLSDQKLMQISLHKKDSYQIGDIFVGRVDTIVPSIDAAFIQFTQKEKGFLPLSNMPKEAIRASIGEEKLKGQSEILVQIEKEAIKTKDAMLTGNLTFQNNYFIFMPFDRGIHFSKKMNSLDKERILSMMQSFVDSNLGIIIRTSAKDCEKEVLHEAYLSLYKQMSDCMQYAKTRKIYSKLYTRENFYIQVLWNQVYNQEHEIQIITDQNYIYESLQQTLSTEQFHKVKLYNDAQLSVLALYGIQSQIKQALDEKVWLKSGGYLFIQPTEALTVIDVNSGKNASKKEIEEANLKTNLEACDEIARQLRLRNISGIIIIDFINQQNEQSTNLILNKMKRLVKEDPIETNIVDITPLHLMEITRKKTTASLREQLNK